MRAVSPRKKHTCGNIGNRTISASIIVPPTARVSIFTQSALLDGNASEVQSENSFLGKRVRGISDLTGYFVLILKK